MIKVSILIPVRHSELGFSTIKKGNSNHGYLVLKCDSLHSGDFYFLNSTFFVFVSIVIEKILENKHTIFHVVWFIIRGKTWEGYFQSFFFFPFWKARSCQTKQFSHRSGETGPLTSSILGWFSTVGENSLLSGETSWGAQFSELVALKMTSGLSILFMKKKFSSYEKWLSPFRLWRSFCVNYGLTA